MKNFASPFNHVENPTSTLVYIPGKPHPIGQIVGGTFNKTGIIYRKLDAFAIEASLIPRLRKAGVAFIEVKEKDTGLVYSIPFDEFMRHAEPIDEGWGAQVACPRKYFKASGHEQLKFVEANSNG